MAPPKDKTRKRADSAGSSVSGTRARVHRLPLWRQRVGHIVDHKYVTIVMTIFTIFALFGDDFRLAVFKPSADDVFFGLSSVALLLFTVELVMNSIGKADYVFGFYFWLDALATLSLIPDIGWIWNLIVDEDNSPDATGAVRAGRASRAGTRAGRIVRIVRLVRLIRIAKLYKHLRGEEVHKKEQALLGEHVDGMVDPELHMQEHEHYPNDHEALPTSAEPVADIDEPSAVGKHLSDLTTRRVILLVLGMIICIPLFDINTWTGEEDEVQFYGIDATHAAYFAASGDANDPNFLRQVFFLADSGKLLHLTVNNTDLSAVLEANSDFVDASNLETLESIDDNFRSAEAPLLSSTFTTQCYDAAGVQVGGDCPSFAFFNVKEKTQLEAWLNVCKTIFVMIVLASGAILFTRDAETIVIGPIERMVTIVKKLAEDPLAAIKNAKPKDDDKGKSEHSYETRLLEKTLTKVSGLLQIGFGEAGAEIISQNLKSGALNPLLDGKMISAIFGFCDIRQFTDTTECLQAQVMVFVNQVGAIVHFATSQYGGSVNKNIGDAFLLAWKLNAPPVPPSDKDALGTPGPGTPSSKGLQYAYSPSLHASTNMAGAGVGTSTGKKPQKAHSSLGRAAMAQAHAAGQESKAAANGDETTYSNPMHRSQSVRSTGSRSGVSQVTSMHDSALFAFLKIIVDVENSNRAGMLRQWQEHPGVKRRFKGEFWVRMGFGLHTGWAVEGAIGSRYKIDASYLSPNVNMASRLEAATKQFRTPLLISQKFWENLSLDAQNMTRAIDRVTVKGSEEPITLYAVDVTYIPSKLGVNEIDLDEDDLNIPANRRVNFASATVRSLQKGLHPDFFATFKRATDAYFDGDFTACRAALEEGLELMPNDGPTKTLMEVLEGFNFVAPASWKGFRELTEK